MPLFAAPVIGAGAKAVGGFALSKAKQGWSWLKGNGFSLTSGKWNVRRGADNKQTGIELGNAMAGMSTTTLVGLGAVAYFLFKK